MVTIYDAPVNELIDNAALKLKDIPEIQAPSWSILVRTGVHKQRPPVNKDWWYVRAAAVLRSVWRLGPVGVSKLRVKYGGKKNRGHKPEHFCKASGNILRKILQQLEKAELVKQEKKGVHKGRVITPKGISLLTKAAYETAQLMKKQKPKPETAEPQKEKAVVAKAEQPVVKKEQVVKEIVNVKETEKAVAKTEEKPKAVAEVKEVQKQPVKVKEESKDTITKSQ